MVGKSSFRTQQQLRIDFTVKINFLK